MEEQDYGIVAFLDVIGVREMGRKRAEEISKFMDAFDSLTEQAKEISKKTFGIGIGERGKSAADYTCLTLSDTIIITGKYQKGVGEENDTMNLKQAALICSLIMKASFEKEIYIRGGISVGEFLRRNNSIVGGAVSEVADYYDRPQWIGVSLAPSAHNVFASGNVSGGSLLVEHAIYLKGIGIERDALGVNWPFWMQKGYNADEDKTSLKKHYETIIKNCADPHIANAIKWRNTKRFFEINAKSVSQN